MKPPTGDRTSLALTAVIAGFMVIGMAAGAAMMARESEPDPEAFTDPRGPDRGPSTVEWEVIATYKAIESMTADDQPLEVVDQTLGQLATYASEHPDNPYIQELYLKGLRVAAYYADLADLAPRSVDLYSRFVDHAAGFPDNENVVIESMRFHTQRLQNNCGNRPAEVAELESLARRFRESERVISARLDGIAAASEDTCAQSSEDLRFWTDRLIGAAGQHIELSQGRSHLRIAVDRQFHDALRAGEFQRAEQAIRPVAELVADYPEDFAQAYGGWLEALLQGAESGGDAESAARLRRELELLDRAWRPGGADLG